MSREKVVPLWEKFNLTIDEAAVYFNIGQKKIRRLAADNIDGGFVLQNGVKWLIKRQKFEDFLEKTNAI